MYSSCIVLYIYIRQCMLCFWQIQNNRYCEMFWEKQNTGAHTKWYDMMVISHFSYFIHFFPLLHVKMSLTSQSTLRVLTYCSVEPSSPSHAWTGSHMLMSPAWGTSHCLRQESDLLGVADSYAGFPTNCLCEFGDLTLPFSPWSPFTWHRIICNTF